MIELITKDAGRRADAILDEVYRQRYRVFKEKLGWDVPCVGGREFDQFDRGDTFYLVSWSRDHEINGSWRLLSTARPYMLSTVFSELLEDQQAPHSDRVWETSRFAVEGNENGDPCGSISYVTGELFCALYEFCFANGIDEMVTVHDIRIARLGHRIIGHDALWQSGVHRLGNTRAVAARFAMLPSVLRRIRSKFDIEGSVLHNPMVHYEVEEAA